MKRCANKRAGRTRSQCKRYVFGDALFCVPCTVNGKLRKRLMDNKGPWITVEAHSLDNDICKTCQKLILECECWTGFIRKIEDPKRLKDLEKIIPLDQFGSVEEMIPEGLKKMEPITITGLWTVDHAPTEHRKCPPELHCVMCEGGAFRCRYCGGARVGNQGRLTTHCPHEQMTIEEHEAVCAGKLDFKDGKWVKS